MIPSDFLFLRQARVAEDREEVRAQFRGHEIPFVFMVLMAPMFPNSCGAAEVPLNIGGSPIQHICSGKPCNKGSGCRRIMTDKGCQCLGFSAPEVSDLERLTIKVQTSPLKGWKRREETICPQLGEVSQDCHSPKWMVQY